MLSVIIIAYNESHNIVECVKSVAWADEIVVVDSGSTDNTVALCKDLGCRVIESDWLGFGAQKNLALSHAKHDWVLSIDADERVPLALQDEILTTVQSSQDRYQGYNLPRESSYCGRFIKHAGWYPDPVLRLFKKSTAQFSDDKVHEKVIVNGNVGSLKSPLLHYSFTSLEQVLDKVNHYSTLGAEQLFERGKRATVLKAVGKGWWSFIRSYFLRLGILDGQEGLMLSISNAEGTYYKYAKLALMTAQEKKRGN